VGICFSARSPSTTLRFHVRNIVEMRTNKKVIWIYARSDVAAMQNVHSFRNRPVLFLPREPMSVERFSTDHHAAISSLEGASRPNQAAALWNRNAVGF
jgi:hypothetical protein